MTQSADILTRWFGWMDSETPECVLGMIAEDFHQTILFSDGEAVSEFDGDRVSLEGYLAQREVSALTHHVLCGTRIGDIEMVLGETRRAGAFEASFNATAQLTADGGLVRTMLICRSPGLRFAT